MMKINLKSTLYYRFGALFSLLVLLQGCQNIGKEHIEQQINYSDKHQRQLDLAKLNDWKVSGKLIFKGPKKKFSASLNWTQQLDKSDIRLTSFLGTSIMKMVNDKYSAVLQADGKTYQSHNPESLLYNTTGLTLPINQLPQWMKGASMEYQDHSTVFDEQHRIKQIKLLDTTNHVWQIDYQGYQQVAQHQLPKRIRLSGNGIVATIKIAKWELNPSD